MATTFTGLRVQDTYNAILKIGDNSNLTGTAKILSDGLGNSSAIYLSTTSIGIGVTPSYQLHTSSNAKIGGNLIVSGNLTVNGTLTYLNVEDLAVEDPLIKLAKDNTANTLDIGFFGKYVATSTKYKGLFNDASDDKFKLFIGTGTEPTTTVDISASGYSVGTLVANLEGNVTGGTISGTTGTFSSTLDVDGNATFDASILHYKNSTLVTKFFGETGSGYNASKLEFYKNTDLQIRLNGVDGSITSDGNLSVGGTGAFTGNLTGSTASFSGLVSGIAPTADLNFATKKYVDDNIPTITTPALSTVLSAGNTSGSNNLIIQDNDELILGSGSDFRAYHNETNTLFRIGTGDLIFNSFVTDGDIKFQLDNGSDSLTEYMRLDGGTENIVFIKPISGTTGSFSGTVDITGTNDLRIADGSITSSQSSTTNPVARFTDTGVADYDWTFPDSSTIQLGVNTSSTKTLKLVNSGSGNFNFVAVEATFTGLVTGIAPTSDLNFATKKYVDDSIPTIPGTPALSAVLAIGNTSGANNIIMADNQKILVGTDSDLELFFSTTDGHIRNNTGDLYIQNLADDKSIYFQCDNGSGDVDIYSRINGIIQYVQFFKNVAINKANAILEIGESGSGGTFGFIGWNDASNYLYFGNSYNSAFNKDFVISNTGNIGINNTTPAKKLEITSTVDGDGILLTGDGGFATGSSRNIEFSYNDTDTSYASTIKFEVKDNTNHGGQIGFFTDAGPSSSATQGVLTRAMTIDPSQNVGINTDSPARKLHVVNPADTFVARFTAGASSDVNIGIFGHSTSYFGSIGTESNHRFSLFTNGVDRLNITNTGQIGINTLNPDAQLDVAGNIRSRVASNVAGGFYIGEGNTAEAFGLLSQGANGYFKIRDEYHNSDRFYIKNNGMIGINTTDPTSKLDVREDANNVYSAYFYNSNSGANAHGINVQTATTNAGAYAFRVNSGSNSNALTVMGNARVGIGTALPQALLSLTQANGANIRFTNSTTGRFFTIGEGVGTNDKFSFRGNSYRSTDTLTVDFTNNRVGINTISPGSTLEVVGGSSTFSYSDTTPSGSASSVYRDAVFGSTDTTNTGITIFGTGQTGISFGDAGSNIRGQVRYQHPTDTLELGSSGNINMIINSSGNVGIATTAIPPDTYTASGGGWKVLQIGQSSQIAAYGTDDEIAICQNTYLNTSGVFQAITSDVMGSSIILVDGKIYFKNATTSGTTQTTTTRMFIDTFGNVEVSNGGLFLNKSDGAYVALKHNNSLKGYLGVANQTITGGTTSDIGLTASNNLIFGSGGTSEKMRIVSAGAVGINNSSPDSFSGGGSTTASLVIGKGTSGVSPHITLWQGNSAQAALTFASANTGAGQYEGRIRYTRDTGVMDFRTNGVANVLVLNAYGNVGINNSSPAKKLEISSATNADGILLTGIGTGFTSGSSRNIEFSYTDTDTSYASAIKFEVKNSAEHGGQISFWTDAGPSSSSTQGTSVRTMTVDRNQNVGIGIESPARKFHVYNNANGFISRFTGGASSDVNIGMYGHSSAAFGSIGTESGHRFSLFTSGTDRLNILSNGLVGINCTPSYQLDVTGTIRATSDVIAFSDKRVKENIKTVDNALNTVTKLRGVTYTRKDIDDKSTKVGVIAQEVLKVLPEVVKKDNNDMYSVAYGNMAGVFIEAIKELKAEVDNLKQEIKELKK